MVVETSGSLGTKYLYFFFFPSKKVVRSQFVAKSVLQPWFMYGTPFYTQNKSQKKKGCVPLQPFHRIAPLQYECELTWTNKSFAKEHHASSGWPEGKKKKEHQEKCGPRKFGGEGEATIPCWYFFCQTENRPVIAEQASSTGPSRMSMQTGLWTEMN